MSTPIVASVSAAIVSPSRDVVKEAAAPPAVAGESEGVTAGATEVGMERGREGEAPPAPALVAPQIKVQRVVVIQGK